MRPPRSVANTPLVDGPMEPVLPQTTAPSASARIMPLMLYRSTLPSESAGDGEQLPLLGGLQQPAAQQRRHEPFQVGGVGDHAALGPVATRVVQRALRVAEFTEFAESFMAVSLP